MSAYQKELGRLLRLSTLTPAHYIPSDDIKQMCNVAVCVNGKPVVLMGPADDAESVSQAQRLCKSEAFRQGLWSLGLEGELEHSAIDGAEMTWLDGYSSVATSRSGQVESGDEIGDLMAIVVADPSGSLATWMSVNTEIAQIMDPRAPELDDGVYLSDLARQYTGVAG